MARNRGRVGTVHEELSTAQAADGWEPVTGAPSGDGAARAAESEPAGVAVEEGRLGSPLPFGEAQLAGWVPGMVMEPTRAEFVQLGRLDGRGLVTNIARQMTVVGVRDPVNGRLIEIRLPGFVVFTADQMQMGVPVRYLVRDAETGRITGFTEVFIPPRRLEYVRYESVLAEPLDELLPAPSTGPGTSPPAGTPILGGGTGSDGGAPQGPDLQTLTAAFAGGTFRG